MSYDAKVILKLAIEAAKMAETKEQIIKILEAALAVEDARKPD